MKLQPSHNLELQQEAPVCGIDEAGRGPLAGPVVAACVHIPAQIIETFAGRGINDSKKLTRRKRSALYQEIKEHCPHGIALASAEEIDTMNIHNASLLAMARAFSNMRQNYTLSPRTALIDGKFTPVLPCRTIAVIGGDGLSVSIAAASILAKVTRDTIMEELAGDYPAYGWAKNAGYGTAAHLGALRDHGPTPHHRRSYAPVKALLASI